MRRHTVPKRLRRHCDRPHPTRRHLYRVRGTEGLYLADTSAIVAEVTAEQAG